MEAGREKLASRSVMTSQRREKGFISHGARVRNCDCALAVCVSVIFFTHRSHCEHFPFRIEAKGLNGDVCVCVCVGD